MKSLKTIQSLSKIGKVLSKILFIFSVIGLCSCIAGLVGLSFGGGSIIRIGSVVLHGWIPEEFGYNVKSIGAALLRWAVVCAGEGVVARFAEGYFQNELKAGTPFTLAGAKELLRLGILNIAVPIGCTVLGSILESIAADLMKVEKFTEANGFFNNDASIGLGVMFILGSLLCRYGAELREGREA